MIKDIFVISFLWITCLYHLSWSEKVFLLDTTTKSSLDWPHYRPNADASETSRGWLEESYSHEERGALVNWRSYVVCDIAYPAPPDPGAEGDDSENDDHPQQRVDHNNDRDNWLSTPFIKLPSEKASPNRIFVEITFNIRDCGPDNSPARTGCKETFAVAYHLVRDQRSGFLGQQRPPWRYAHPSSAFASSTNTDSVRSGWTLLDRVTGTRPGNITTRTLTFPLNSDGEANGFYLAFHDTGACLSLLALRVYALACPNTVLGRAALKSTWTGPDLTSVVTAKAACLPHSGVRDEPTFGHLPPQSGSTKPLSDTKRGLPSVQYLCKADGTWFETNNKSCSCDPGHQPDPAAPHLACSPCPEGTYKHSSGDFACSICPANSASKDRAAIACQCTAGHYRPPSIFYSDTPCATPPPAPANLTAIQRDSSSLTLTWAETQITFSAREGTVDNHLYKSNPITYRLGCDVCGYSVKYSPSQVNLNETRVTISHLKPGTIYNFVVYAENALSQIAGISNYASITITTENSVLNKVGGLMAEDVGRDYAKLSWNSLISYDSDQPISFYEITYKRLGSDDKFGSDGFTDVDRAVDDNFENNIVAKTNGTNATLQDLYPGSRYLVKRNIPHHIEHSGQFGRSFSFCISFLAQVRARNAKGVGDYSEGLILRTLALQNEVTDDGAIVEFSVRDVEEDNSALESLPNQSPHHLGFIVGGALVTLLTAICLVAAVLLFLKRKRQSCKGKTSSDCDSLDVRTGPEVMTPLFPPSFFKSTLTSLGRGCNGFAEGATSHGTGPNPKLSYHTSRHQHQTENGLTTSYAVNASALDPSIYAAHQRANKLFYGGVPSDPNASFKRQTTRQTNDGVGGALILPNLHAKGISSFRTGHRGTSSKRYVLATSSSHTLATELANNSGSLSFSGGAENCHGQPLRSSHLLHTYEDPNHFGADRQSGGAKMYYDAPEIDPTRVIFEAGALVGRGEFGEVCRASLKLDLSVQAQSDRGDEPAENVIAVAVKTLKPGASEKARVDFLAEAQIMAHFEDENVIRLLGIMAKHSPTPAIVTEYMEHGALDIFLRNNEYCFRISQLLDMLKGIGSGMRYLSELCFVHRDLAARNILVNQDLICKVSDFGLSREIEGCLEGAYTTKGGKIPVRWTAPEAISYRRFTTASDVWSYGVLAWEVLSYGDRPYWNWSNQDVVTAVDKGYRLPPPMYCPEIVHRLMLKCWLSESKSRPNFRQVCELLGKIILDEESQNLPATFKPQNYDPFGIDAFNTVEDWLNSIKMGRYAQTFERAGISSLQQAITQLPGLSPQALLDRLGIVPLGHRNKILLSIRSLQYPFPANQEIYRAASTQLQPPQTLGDADSGSPTNSLDESFYQAANQRVGLGVELGDPNGNNTNNNNNNNCNNGQSSHGGHINLMMFNSDSDATNSFPRPGNGPNRDCGPVPVDFYYYHQHPSDSRPENFKSIDEQRHDKLGNGGFLV